LWSQSDTDDRRRKKEKGEQIYLFITVMKVMKYEYGRSGINNKQESHAVAGKPRDAAVNSDRYRVRWHFAGAISVSRMQ